MEAEGVEGGNELFVAVTDVKSPEKEVDELSNAEAEEELLSVLGEKEGDESQGKHRVDRVVEEVSQVTRDVH